MPAKVYGRYERAEAAHKNGMENLALFVGEVLAGNVAKLDNFTLNVFIGSYLLLCIVYTFIYINVSSHRYSHYRTAVWYVFLRTIASILSDKLRGSGSLGLHLSPIKHLC